jgi:hypothetical protein
VGPRCRRELRIGGERRGGRGGVCIVELRLGHREGVRGDGLRGRG